MYLFIDILLTEFIKWQTEFREGFIFCLLFSNSIILSFSRLLSKVTYEGRDLGKSRVAFVGGAFQSMSHGSFPDFLGFFSLLGVFPVGFFSGLGTDSVLFKLSLSPILVYRPHIWM